MTEEQILRHEVAKVMTRAYPPVVMTLEDIAALLGMSYTYVKDTVQHEPGFPPRLDRFRSPRWSREVVMQWAGVNGQ